MKIMLLPIILFSIFTTAAGMKAGEATQPKAGTQLQVRTIYPTSYDELIEKIVQGRRFSFPEYEQIEISPCITMRNDYEIPGYLLMDLDGDGTDELLLGENSTDDLGPNEGWDSIIYDIFTMQDGRMIHVAWGAERDRYYLCENGLIANESSGGAAFSVHAYYNYAGGKLNLVDCTFTDDGEDHRGIHIYYSRKEAYEDYSDEITQEEWERFRNKYSYRKLRFTPFD